MITFTLVAVLGVLLAMTLKQLFHKEPAAPAQPAEDLSNLPITAARVGDMVSITGAGDDFSDLDFKIDKHNTYEAGEKRWVELGGMYRNRRIYLEVLDGDELEVAVVLNPNKMTIDELGLNEQDLTELDQRQNTGDNFEFEGKLFYYRFSREITMYRDGQAQPTGYYMWEFREDGGKRLLTIRKGEGEPFTASMGTVVNPGDITVFRG